MLKKKYLKKENNIYIFEFLDLTVKKVKAFYKDDPFPNYEIDDNKATVLNRGNNNLYTASLKKFIGHNKKILEVGAGTSQLSNYLAIGNNNFIVAFDANYESLLLGSEFSKKNEINNIEYVCGDIFDNIFEESYFDIALCNGVLHHTKNSFEAFKKSLKCVKKDGFILVGLYNKYGRFRTLVRKYLYKILGKKYLMLFDPVLRKINKQSVKKIDAWIKDQYTHPIERSHSFDDVLKWFNETNVEFINSYPSCDPFNEKNEEELLKKLFYPGNRRNFLERILSQLLMIFSRSGSEGGLYLFLGKKK